MTVYQLAILFEKKAKHNLAQGHIMILGGRIKKAFLNTYPGHTLPIVTSVERKGTFKSFDYPDYFIPRMDEILVGYIDELMLAKAKKISEKPVNPVPPKAATSGLKKKRQRTKIPTNKPVFSGSKLK